jgi:type IV pilus assembly protein PilC
VPYFKWKGVNLLGEVQQGVLRARSLHDLDEQLLRKEIGLMRAQLKKSILGGRISMSMQVTFFRQLAILVNAGVYIDRAISLLAKQTTHRAFRELLEDVSADVQHGAQLSKSLQSAELFDVVVIQMIQAGQDAGKLSQALEMISDYVESKEQFFKKLRSAALIPTITFTAFIGIAVFIMVTIIPPIGLLFSSSGQELPAVTRILLGLSQLITTVNGFALLGIFVSIFFALRLILKRFVISDRIVLFVPIFGQLIKESSVAYYLYAAGLLMYGRVNVVQSLNVARSSIKNRWLSQQFSALETMVDRGIPLSQSLEETGLIGPDVCGMVMVGEQAGNMGFMLMRAADLYKERINRRLLIISSLVQPVLMIILAFLILGLIVAVYMPLFNLSSVIT